MNDKPLKKNVKPIYLKLDPELQRQLDEYCLNQGRTRTLVVEKLIEKAFEINLLEQITDWRR